MRVSILASLACAFFGIGCACSGAASNVPGQGAVMASRASRAGLLIWVSNGDAITAEVEGGELFGSAVRLSLRRAGQPRTEDDAEDTAAPGAGAGAKGHLQGSVFDRPVSVVFDGGSAHGVFGNAPFNLALEDAPKGVTHARGLVAGELSDYEMGDGQWSGHVGRCGYELRGTESAFEGYRSCGGERERVRIEIGSRLSAWSPLEKATVLALLLRS